MKRSLFGGVIVIALIVSSCTSLQPINGEKKYEIENVVLNQNGYITEWIPIYIMLEWNSVKGMQIAINNQSSNPITIIWEKSSITYKDQTHAIFISGQKYLDAGKAAPSLTIPANGKVTKEIYPAENVTWMGSAGWKITGMGVGKKDTVTISICVNADGKEFYITSESKSPISTGFGIWFFK